MDEARVAMLKSDLTNFAVDYTDVLAEDELQILEQAMGLLAFLETDIARGDRF